MKKRLFMTLLFLCISIFVLGTVSASAAEYGDFSYEVEDGEVTIMLYFGESTEITIPSEIAGMSVTKIDEYAFSSCTTLEYIKIPASVTEIGGNIGAYCGNLYIDVDDANSIYCDVDGVVYTKDTLTVTVSGNYTGTATKAWSIARSGSATGTAPTANTLTYNGSAQALVTAGTATGGTMLYRLGENGQFSTTIPTGTDADTYTVYWYVKGDANHGDSAVNSVSVTIAAKPVTNANVEITLGESLSYTGSAQTQTVVSVKVDGVALSANEYTVSDNTGTNVGNYTLTVTVSGNYTGTATKTWSIAQSGSATGTAPVANTLTYNGSAQALVTAGTATGGTMLYSLDKQTWSDTIPTGTNAGNYTVYWYVKGDANHGDSAIGSVSVTIAAKPVTNANVEITLGESLSYTGSAQTQTVVSVKVDGVTLDPSEYTVSGNTATNVGNYTLTVTVSGNYTGTASKSWSIELSVTPGDIDGDGEVTMDDAIHLFNATMFPEAYPIPAGQRTDYDGNGVFNMDDAIYLFNYTMFPSAYPI